MDGENEMETLHASGEMNVSKCKMGEKKNTLERMKKKERDYSVAIEEETKKKGKISHTKPLVGESLVPMFYYLEVNREV